MSLVISGLTKCFDDHVALDGISLTVGAHEFVCLLGPSGCGKTTLLRIIAGLLPFDSGRLTMAGRDLGTLPARERGFGIVFQSYSLFPNMTVADNIGYGLKIRGQAKAAIQARVQELLALIRLPTLADRYPWQLSGGQQQRVALARAIAVEPSLILLDEPLSALDAQVRTELRAEIRDLQRRLGIPTIMVTHDQDEALTLADTIVCMNHGKIEQVGSPRDLYRRPASAFVAQFMGRSNLLPHDWIAAHCPGLLTGAPAQGLACIRPEDISLTTNTPGDALVRDVTYLGNFQRLTIGWRGQELLVDAPATHDISPGQAVGLDLTACHWIAP